MNKRIVNLPVGGMDTDSENRMVDFKDYRYALNIRNGVSYLKRLGGTTNVKGNTKVVTTLYPYSDGVAPIGRNKCIGTYEDKQYGTMLFFIYNSEGNHQIMRYFPDNKSATSPYGEVHQICLYDFGWKSYTKITSVDLVAGHLLYWCDNIHSRKLNIDKAELVNKHKSWVVHYPKTNQFTQSGVITFTYEINGALYNRRIAVNNTYDTTSDALQFLETELTSQLGHLFTFNACNCKLEVVENGTDIKNVIVTGYEGVTNADNFYGYNFLERYVNLVKYPPTFNPTAIFRKDTSKKYNYVKNKVFQFRLQYVYDDHEKSALSPISQIASGNTAINQAQADSLNYIDVDFNNTDIYDVENWVLIKWVRLFVIEHNTGKWRQIADLDPCEFYDIESGQKRMHYKFFNDVDSVGVDDALSAKLYDDVPIKNQCQKFVKNRLALAGITQNYDAPECLDAKISMDFDDAKEEKYTITAKIRIINPSYVGNANLDLTDKRQIKGAIVKFPATDGTFDYPVWGGLPTTLEYIQSGVVNGGEVSAFKRTFNKNQGTDYEQWLPEGGFVGYLAGTDYLGVSVQKTVNANVTPSVVGVGKAFDGSDILTSRSYIVGQPYDIPNTDSALVQLMIDDNADIYSELKITGVPNGTYVLRLASHWCSYAESGGSSDKLGKGTMYNLNNRRSIQKTSTNVIAVKDNSNVIKEKEFEIIVTVNGGNVDAGEFFVSDQTSCYNFKKNNSLSSINPFDLNFSGYRFSIGQTGYLVDNDGKYDDNDIKVAIGMEKQWIDPYIKYSIKDSLVKNYTMKFQSVPTDHNGYYHAEMRADYNFMIAALQSVGVNVGYPAISSFSLKDLGTAPKKAFGYDLTYNEILLNSLVVYNSDSVLKDVQTSSLTPQTITAPTQGFVGVSSNTTEQFLMPCVLPTASQQLKTYIKGEVLDSNGDGFSGVSVIYSGTGRVGTTDADGDWIIPIYAESISAKTTPLTRNDNTIYYLNGITATFANNNWNDVINGIGSVYTYAYPYTTLSSPNTCIVSTKLFGKTHKRGGNYIYALRFYDYGGRLCSVVSAPNLNIYVPFITEDLSVYFPNDFLPQTYLNGKPSINWELIGKPPVWAYTYQWMRTKDTHYRKYLSWITNSVKYISKIYQDEDNPETVTSYGNGDATNIMLDISNITDYKRRNPDSLVTYEYEQGDKVRLIRSQDGIYYEGLVEYEVVAYQTTGSYLILKNDIGAPEIKAGTQIEIYHTRDLQDEKGQVFYEVGECFACTNPDSNVNDYSVKTGTFTNGDTYWKPREILVNDTITQFTGTFNYAFEDASISDFYQSNDSDIGRVGQINKDFVRQFRPTLHLLSNVFIPDTQVNGLSNFEPLNNKELDRNYGLVERLMYTGDTMFSICHNKIVSNYIGERILAEARDNTGVVAVADDFFGTDRAQLYDFGCQNPESVIQQDNSIYGIDAYRGIVWRHAQNGTVPISSINNNALFKNICSNGVFDAVAGIDRFYNEYIITIYKSIFASATSVVKSGINVEFTFSPMIDISVNDEIDVTFYDTRSQSVVSYRTNVVTVNGNKVVVALPEGYNYERDVKFENGSVKYKGDGETISWCEEKNKWVGYYSFVPERYGIVYNNFMSLINGELWIHDTNEVRNNFYGVQYTSKLTPVFVGEDTSTKKIWECAKIEQFQSNQKCDWSAPEIYNDYNQKSRLAKTFIKKEEHWSNPFKRDLNDVTVPLNKRILNGRMLRSTSLTVEFENDYTDEFTLRAFVAEFIPSLAY